MYKTTSRNMQSRVFRSQKAGAGKVRLKSSKLKRGDKVKRIEKPNNQTEPELVGQLGMGPHYARGILRRFGKSFAELDYDPKRCSAFLNIVAHVRMIDDSLWTDAAVKSVFRRALPKRIKS